MKNEPRDHHYVPQFLLRNFAIDPERRKITTVAKHGHLAVWAQRSIEGLGFERDLYVHTERGIPVSVEAAINRRIETPISKSDTWHKIASGKTELLDRSDKPILYALIRHLEARTPHYLETASELSRLASLPNSAIPFTLGERRAYAQMRSDPEGARRSFNAVASSLEWTERGFRGAAMSVYRSPIPLRASTVPVLPIRAPDHPALHLPLPGMVPFQRILTLNPYTMLSLVMADFDDAFTNDEVSIDIAKGFNRYFVGQFSHFQYVRHLVTDRDGIEEDMDWASYEFLSASDKKISFRRRSREPA